MRGVQSRLLSGPPRPRPTYCDRNLQPASEPPVLFGAKSVIQDGAIPKSQDTAVRPQPGHLKPVEPRQLPRGRAAPPRGPHGASVRVSASRRFRLSGRPGGEEGRACPRPPTSDPRSAPPPPSPPASPSQQRPGLHLASKGQLQRTECAPGAQELDYFPEAAPRHFRQQGVLAESGGGVAEGTCAPAATDPRPDRGRSAIGRRPHVTGRSRGLGGQ